MVRRAKALEADDWERLERRPRYTSRTGKTRSRREDVKFADRAGARLRQQASFNYEDVAEYDYQPTSSAARPTGWSWCARTSASLKGDLTLLDEIRHFFYITTRRDLRQHPAVGGPAGATPACDQENVIASS